MYLKYYYYDTVITRHRNYIHYEYRKYDAKYAKEKGQNTGQYALTITKYVPVCP